MASREVDDGLFLTSVRNPSAILVYRKSGIAAVGELFKRAFDANRVGNGLWYTAALLTMPLIMVLSFFVIRISNAAIPLPTFSVPNTVGLIAVFFIAALGEEIGWTGYALDPLQEKFGPIMAGIIIGLVWALWHFLPLAQAHRAPDFIAWWTLGTVSARLIMVWLYNSTRKSVFITTLFHAMINVSWQLFPINGSFYDPQITGSITAVVTISIVVLWTLRRKVSTA